MKTSVGLLVLTAAPDGQLKALLHRRGNVNPETNKPETYPGIYQVTAHGGVEPTDDSVEAALIREIDEEVGEKAAMMLKKIIAESPKSIAEINRTETEKEIVITFAAKLPWQLVSQIVDLGAFRLVNELEVKNIQTATPEYKKDGVTDQEKIVMFPDEKTSLQKAFVIFK